MTRDQQDLVEFYQKYLALKQARAAQIEARLPPAFRKILEEISAEFDPQIEELRDHIKDQIFRL